MYVSDTLHAVTLMNLAIKECAGKFAIIVLRRLALWGADKSDHMDLKRKHKRNAFVYFYS